MKNSHKLIACVAMFVSGWLSGDLFRDFYKQKAGINASTGIITATSVNGPSNVEGVDIPNNRYRFPVHKTISDIKDGERACATVFFTIDGSPMFLRLDQELDECDKNSDVVMRLGDKFYARLSHKPRDTQRSGYDHAVVPVILVLSF